MALFKDLGLDDFLVSAVEDLGYTEPTPIQEQTIPALLQGESDCIALAQTGTGKTAAFGLPIIQQINPQNKETQALIVAPTRELCIQIQKDLESFAKYEKGINIVAVYGGADARDQRRKLRNGAQIICATPGRLLDFVQKGDVDLEPIEIVVLDEADEMLNMGFLDDIKYVLKNTPNRDSLWLFSATMPKEINKIAKQHMEDPIEISVAALNSTNEDIKHEYYLTGASKRYDTLKRILDFHPEIFGVIFTRTKRDARKISQKLNEEGYACNALHGDMEQKDRDVVMNRFRNNNIQILVATDVAARGIDVTGITHVVNYELPDDPEVYTHRSGRTGRAGNKGVCFSIVTKRDIPKVRQIEKICKTPFEAVEIPQAEDVLERQILHSAEKFKTTRTSSEEIIEDYMESLMDKLGHMDKEELIVKFFSQMLDSKIRKQGKGEDLNESVQSGPRSDGKRQSIFINLGTKDGFNDRSLKKWISDNTDFSQDLIYRVHTRDLVSFFDVEASIANDILIILNKQKHKNRKLRVDLSHGKGSKGGNNSRKKPFKPGRKGKYKYSKT